MSVKVQMIADSIGPNGVRISTMLCEYGRIVHSELMTHRNFSRNASSSRAIPFKTQIKILEENMFVPLRFQKRHSGMQGTSYFDGWREKLCKRLWKTAGKVAITSALTLDRIGVTKQLTNRILEPFTHIKVVITSTEWNNFFNLRDHEAAEIHIQELAREMKKVYNNSTPNKLESGQWHLPFIDFQNDVCISEHPIDWDKWKKVSVARCARTSYLNNFGKNDLDADMKLFDQLINNDPKHASPTEHQAQALPESFNEILVLPYIGEIPKGCEIKVKDINGKRFYEIWSGNIRGWIQYRKTIDNENANYSS
jgi:hypothetical protein